MKRAYFTAVAALLAACGQQPSGQNTVSEPVVAVSKPSQMTFEKQVFVFADEFNAKMLAAKSPLAIAGAAIKDETLQAGGSKMVAITPHLQVNWLPNVNGSDIETLLITHGVHNAPHFQIAKPCHHIITHGVHNAPQDEFAAVNALLVTQSGMVQTEQFYALMTERIQRVMEMRKLAKADELTQHEFEFAGFKWKLGMNQQFVFYSRTKMN